MAEKLEEEISLWGEFEAKINTMFSLLRDQDERYQRACLDVWDLIKEWETIVAQNKEMPESVKKFQKESVKQEKELTTLKHQIFELTQRNTQLFEENRVWCNKNEEYKLRTAWLEERNWVLDQAKSDNEITTEKLSTALDKYKHEAMLNKGDFEWE